MSNNEDLILLNRMYAGEFLNNNIGFEAINLVKADDDTSYIYVTPYGTMAEDKYEKVKVILFVKPYSKGSYQIIAKAVGLQLSEEIKNYLHTPKDLREEQETLRKIQEYKIKQIKYSRISYNEIFVDNRSTTKKGNSINGAYYTYTGKVFLAKKLLTISNVDFENSSKKLFRSSLKMYISPNEKVVEAVGKKLSDKSSIYNYLKGFIDNKENWEQKEVQQIKVQKEINQEKGFINVLGKEDDELSYSNLFAYIFLKYKEAFAEFCKNVLCTDKNIKDKSVNGFNFDCDNDIKIEREKYNIDLKLTDINGNVIVIENKIKSNINGVDSNGSVAVKSQLSKYYDLVSEEVKKRKTNAWFFIFVPNYHNLQLKDNILYKDGKEIKWSYENADKYKIINYKEIYDCYKDWFSNETNKNKLNIKEQLYLEEFLLALKKHTKNVDNQLEEELKIKFNNRIYQLKQNSEQE